MARRPKPQPTPVADDAYRQGLACYQAGQWPQAMTHVEQALAADKRHLGALSLQGVLCLQTGQNERAVTCFERALALQPGQASLHSNLGIALKRLGRHAEAIQRYEAALALKPDYAEAHYNRGLCLRELNQNEAAVDSFGQAVALHPAYADAHNNLGLAQQALGRFDAACASFERAAALRPDLVDAHSNLGVLLQRLGRYDAALACHDRAVAAAPTNAHAHYNRARTLQELQRPEQALASYDQALALDPAHAQACNNRGLVLQRLGRLEEALASFERAIALQPDYAEAHSNRGVLLQDLGRIEESIQSYDQAIALGAHHAPIYSNRGNLLSRTGQLGESVASYDQALERQPDFAEGHWNKALALLLQGNYLEGWPLYEWRWRRDNFSSPKRNFTQPLWLGDTPLTGKTILLHAEQGLGDTLQFCRYAKQVKALGARVVLEVQPALAGLMATLAGVDQVVPEGQPLPPFDAHCPLMSLPLAFKTTLDTIPTPGPYLQAPADKLTHWRQRLGEKRGLRVGLVWRGNTIHKNDHNRSVALAALLPHLPQGPQYVSLQREMREEDAAALAQARDTWGLQHFGEALADFSDTAALCSLMDLVVCVDTSVAHLAGALGVPTRVLLPSAPDWRWLLGRNDSPWYASVQLLRQGPERAWAPVLTHLQSDLQQLAGTAPSAPTAPAPRTPRLNILGQRNILGGGVHYANFVEALKRFTHLKPLIHELDATKTEGLSAAMADASEQDVNIWFFQSAAYGQLKGRNVVWAIFESDILPDHYLAYVNSADLVWVPSHWGRDVLIRQGVNPERIDVVPEGVDPAVFHPFGRKPRQPGDNKFTFLALGKYEERKGYAQLFAAFKQAFANHPDVELVIKGDYFIDLENKRNRLVSDVQQLGLSNIKIVTGAVNTDKLLALYNSADAFVFPTRAEGWGLPLTEALACGVPTLTTNYSGHSEFLSTIEGLYCPLDFDLVPLAAEFRKYWSLEGRADGVWAEVRVDDLAEKMQAVVRERDAWAEKGLKASESIRAMFSWQRAADAGARSLVNSGFLDEKPKRQRHPLELEKYDGQIYLLMGGAGDFLQCIPFMLANKHHKVRYVVATHLKDADNIFETIGVAVEEIKIFNGLSEQRRIISDLNEYGGFINCPRIQYFEFNPFSNSRKKIDSSEFILGVQLGASKFSIKEMRERNVPTKNLPHEIIQILIDMNEFSSIYVFGSRDEILEIQSNKSEKLKLILTEKITDSLGMVGECDVFFGSDSVYKTMSSMLKIPTFVCIKNEKDDFRDGNFINPYVRDGIMNCQLNKLQNLSDINCLIENFKDFIRKIEFSNKGIA